MTNIGHNAPPPDVAIAMALDDLELEAGNWLDGAALETQDQADALGALIGQIKRLKSDADRARAAEKKPHDDAAKAVQAKWKAPIIDRADTIIKMANRPLADWLFKLQAEKQAAAKAAQAEADRAAREAQELNAKTQADNLADAYAREAALKKAAAAQAKVNRIDKTAVNVTGNERAMSLRTYYHAEIADRNALLKWAMTSKKDELTQALQVIADRAVKAGERNIAGVNIIEEKRVA